MIIIASQTTTNQFIHYNINLHIELNVECYATGSVQFVVETN